MTRCRLCGHAIVQQEEKAIGSGEVQIVWTSTRSGEWVCERNDGNEHEPGRAILGTHIVVEGSPVDGFVFHGIPAFIDEDEATEWAENNCTLEWWIAPLQDVE